MEETGKKESPFCIYSTKLLHFYTVVCLRALHRLLQQEIVKQDNGKFVIFLSKNAETLFHLRGKKCCCDKWLRSEILNTDQWNYLFTPCTSSIQCPRNQQNCFHTYKARPCLTVDRVDFSLACVLLRNICDSINKESIKALQLHRNEFVHNPSPLDQDEFELLWRKGKTSLCDVANDLPVEMKEQISKDSEMIYNYTDKVTRYIETTACEVTEHMKENLFSPIKVLDMVVNTLEQHGIAIIVGYPGSGKSYIGKEVMRIMHLKDQIVVKVDKVKLWNDLVNPRLGYIVFIDDFLGESTLDSAKLTKLKGYFNTIYACVKNTRTKVVLTVRKSIFERWQDQLVETSSNIFGPEFIIDLTKKEHQMSNEEKKFMLLKHLQRCKIKIMRTKKEAAESSNLAIDQFTVDSISGTTPFNFPLLCFLFSRSKNIQLGQKFFEHPRDTLVKTVDEFRKSEVLKERKKYAVLSYCAISGNNVSLRKLDTAFMTMICDSLELNKFKGGNKVKVMVRDAVEDLKDEYFREIGKETYEFVHQSFLEAMILSCGKVFPELVTEHCSKNTLFELIRTENYVELEGELVLKLDEEYYDKLITRFMREMKTNLKVIRHVLLHPVMEDRLFHQQFLARLTSLLSDEDTPQEVSHTCLIESSKLGQLGTVKACLSLKFPQHVFDAALNNACYNDQAEAVVCFSRVCTAIQFDHYFLQACSFGCKDVVCAMLNYGIIKDVYKIREGIFRSTKANQFNTSLVLIRDYRSKTDAHMFRTTMLNAIIYEIDIEKADFVINILSEILIDFNKEEVIQLVLNACSINQLDLAKFLLNRFCDPTVANLNHYIERFLRGSILSIDIVFDMKEVFQLRKFLVLHNFFTEKSSDFIIKQTCFGSYVIERIYACYPDDIESVCSSSRVIKHLLLIGAHSVAFHLCQKNPELTKSLYKMEKFENNYNFLEFTAYIGFFYMEVIAQDCHSQFNSLFSYCIEGYKNSGTIYSCQPMDSRNNGRSAIYSFETNSHQRDYAACLKKFYNETNKLTNDSPVVKSILEIIYKTFQFDSLDFVNSGNIRTPRLVPISSAKMDVLQFLRHILLQHVDLLQVRGILNCVAGKVVWG